jgi:hypothetical protein
VTVLSLPSPLFRQFREEVPGWENAIVGFMTIGGNPELVVIRKYDHSGQTEWILNICSKSYSELLPIRRPSLRLMTLVVALYLAQLVDSLRTELPDVCGQTNLIAMILGGLGRSRPKQSS